MTASVTCRTCGVVVPCSPKTYKKYIGTDYECRKCASTRAWSDPDRLKRASDFGKQIWSADDPRRLKLLAGAKSDSRRSQISASNKKRWSTDRNGMMLRIFTVDSSIKASEAVKAVWRRPEYLDAQTSRSIEQWNDPVYRERGVATGKACWNDPGYVNKQNIARNTPEFREKMAIILSNQPRISSLQRKLYTYLSDLGVDFLEEGDGTVVGPWVFDCAIPKEGGGLLLIECQGEYWHNRPQQRVRDKSKFVYIERYFPQHEVMYLFEREFSQKDGVVDRLKAKLGFDHQCDDFSFSDVRVEEITGGSVSNFLDLYHYIGKSRGGTSFGAYLGDLLIGVCVFSPPMRGGEGSTELSRFCIHPRYHKKCFASWLVSKCLKRITTTVIAFADTTVGHNGTIYRASNFKLDHEVPSDYWYVNNDGWVMHKLTLYKRAKKNSMTEKDYAESNGFVKKWGGKKLCFVYEPR